MCSITIALSMNNAVKKQTYHTDNPTDPTNRKYRPGYLGGNESPIHHNNYIHLVDFTC